MVLRLLGLGEIQVFTGKIGWAAEFRQKNGPVYPALSVFPETTAKTGGTAVDIAPKNIDIMAVFT